MRYKNLSMPYERWISLNDTLSDKDRDAISRHISKLSNHPVISVIMPCCNTPEMWLRRSIESVRSQLYPYWELCIAYYPSAMPHLRALLEEYTRLDERIRLSLHEQCNAAVASNSALSIAEGEFLAFLNHNDELPQHALYTVAVVLNEKPFLDLIYSDEDKIDENGLRFDPYFKPDWNPDLFTAQNFVRYLCVYRAETVRALGGFLGDCKESQDWDLALRVTESIPASHIHHIPHILYHCRTIPPASSMMQNEKPRADHDVIKMLQDHLNRTSLEGNVIRDISGNARIQYSIPSHIPTVSIIIPTFNGLSLLCRCIKSIKNKTLYSNYEIIIVDNQSDDSNTLDYLNSLEKSGIARILKYNHPFNYSAINNFAAEKAGGEFLCLMNNDIEVISEDWLNEMLGHAARPGIGAVGAMLYYPDNTIQHAGVILLESGVAGHLYAGKKRGTAGYHARTCMTQNLSAVTAACLLIRASTYRDVGGFDEDNLPISFNDVDFCLRVRERGFRNLWTPFAEFYHNESASRGSDDNKEKKERFQRETLHMLARWSHELNNDPAYNPNLIFYYGWPYLAPEPQVKKPWIPYLKKEETSEGF
ncbi:MAG: glycosyltransferase family 2 protein [Proteobacteria bacterium]|nr:glycosyltransferase family 2 protein [Pseudomonadota bacterium]MBU1713127.1 glycosyltransferase family 2 protein [Pseudomonadota bacterium]